MDNSISLGDLAALVTAVGIAVYVVGLLGLSVTIRATFTSNLTTAWYAVSLLPRTVVAGQGLRLWLTWPIIAAVILVPTVQITNRSIILILVTTATAGLASLSFILLWLSYRERWRLRGRANRRVANDSTADQGAIRLLGDLLLGRIRVGTLSYVFMYVGVFMISLGQVATVDGVRLVAQSPPQTTVYGSALEALGIAVDENSFAIGILLILLGAFAMGGPSATVVKPPLPRVQLEMNMESAAKKDDSTSSKGWLVAHSDGFWHLFLEDSGELLSIPDGRVRVARTGEEDGEEEPTPPEKNEAASSEEAPPEEDSKPGAGEDG